MSKYDKCYIIRKLLCSTFRIKEKNLFTTIEIEKVKKFEHSIA